jgi:hypothetical protein
LIQPQSIVKKAFFGSLVSRRKFAFAGASLAFFPHPWQSVSFAFFDAYAMPVAVSERARNDAK